MFQDTRDHDETDLAKAFINVLREKAAQSFLHTQN